jgi:alanine racemase
MTRIEGAVLNIDLAAIAWNWRFLTTIHAGAVGAVLKADAYGLGAAQVAPSLLAAGCRHFFVAHLSEALAIRTALPGAMLAVLNGLIPGAEPIYVEHGILPVLGSLDELDRWTGQARRVNHALPCLLHVDTGMNRLGLDARELAALAADPARLNGADIRYIMTHMISAETPDDPLNVLQRDRFARACAMLPPAPRSLANSSGIFLGPAWASDLARPGAALYGINPTPAQPNPMRPAVRLRARVLQTREIAAGEAVGYNATWRAAQPSRIATVCVGYADGWMRALSGNGYALFDGAPVPLVGRVSMDLTTYDVTDHPAISAGTWLELLGPNLTPEQVAEAAGTNAYEILTSLGHRYAREYAA